MENMKVTVVGDKLTIEIDLAYTGGMETGKGNTLLATSGNWVQIEGRRDLSLNCVVVKRNKK